MRPQGDSQETPGRVQPHSLLRESVTRRDLHRPEPCFTCQSLSSGVELLEVLDVLGVLDGDPVLCLQARGARPGDTGNPKRALPHGRELVQPLPGEHPPQDEVEAPGFGAVRALEGVPEAHTLA